MRIQQKTTRESETNLLLTGPGGVQAIQRATRGGQVRVLCRESRARPGADAFIRV